MRARRGRPRKARTTVEPVTRVWVGGHEFPVEPGSWADSRAGVSWTYGELRYFADAKAVQVIARIIYIAPPEPPEPEPV